jgi:hypothetical protein
MVLWVNESVQRNHGGVSRHRRQQILVPFRVSFYKNAMESLFNQIERVGEMRSVPSPKLHSPSRLAAQTCGKTKSPQQLGNNSVLAVLRVHIICILVIKCVGVQAVIHTVLVRLQVLLH